MGFRTVIIKNRAKLEVRLNSLIVRGEQEKKVFLEEINALIELKQCEFFVFVNLKSVLSDEKLGQIYAHCRAEQVGLLLMEDGKRRPLLPCEKAVIITEDLCEILENYEETW